MSILVTTTKNPDLDDLASAYSYFVLMKKKGRDVVFSYYGDLQFDSKFISERLGINDLQKDLEGPFESFILTDDPELSKLPEVVVPNKVIEIIDHHTNFDLKKTFPGATLQIEEVGASATLIAERWMYDGSFISEEVASLLYSAIQSSTFKLRSPLKDIKDLQASDWLEMEYQLTPNLVDEMFTAKADFVLANLADAIEADAKMKEIKGKKYLITQLEVFDFGQFKDRVDEILKIDADLKLKLEADQVFMNFVDINEGVTYFLAEDKDIKEILTLKFEADFEGNIAKLDKMILRKQVFKGLG